MVETDFAMEKKETAMQQTYNTVKHMILANQLPTGTPIPQTRLMEQFNFSRTPLREALNKLAQEDLVHWEQNKRIIIEPLTDHDIDQLSAMRILLESFAILMTVPKITDEMLEEANQSLILLQKVPADNQEMNETLHRKFHSCFTCGAGEWLNRDIARLNDQATRYRNEFCRISNQLDADAHRKILETARTRDGKATAILVADHYARTTLRVISDRCPMLEPAATRQALRIINGAL